MSAFGDLTKNRKLLFKFTCGHSFCVRSTYSRLFAIRSRRFWV